MFTPLQVFHPYVEFKSGMLDIGSLLKTKGADTICYDGLCTDLVQLIWNVFHDLKLLNPEEGSVPNPEAVKLRKDKLAVFFEKVQMCAKSDQAKNFFHSNASDSLL